jgi:hypothetical protein
MTGLVDGSIHDLPCKLGAVGAFISRFVITGLGWRWLFGVVSHPTLLTASYYRDSIVAGITAVLFFPETRYLRTYGNRSSL